MSRPRPLSSVSGRGSGFDYPPASSRPSVTTHDRDDEPPLTNSFAPRFQHLRRILSRDRNEQRAQRPSGRSSRSDMPPLARSAAQNRRRLGASPPPLPPSRRSHDDSSSSGRDAERRAMFPDPPPRLRSRRSPTSAFTARSSRGRNHSMRSRADRDGSDPLAQLVQVGERLQQEHTSLTELLDTFSPVADSMRRPGSPLFGEPTRPSKRRKTSHVDALPAYVGFKYGHYGQVAPGRLKLEIAHCDGGTFDDDGLNLHTAANVLKNDRSVYCTKTNQCNLLLRHQGDAPFSVQRIVIKAPERGFTAPVQEGLVFISMSPSELMSRSSSYRVSWSPPDDAARSSLNSPASSSTEHSSPDPTEQLTLLEAISDPHIDAAFFRHPAMRSIDPASEYRGRDQRRPSRFPSDYANPSLSASSLANVENCDPPFSFGMAVPPPPPPPPLLPGAAATQANQFPVTTTSAAEEENDDETSSSEEDISGAVLADRQRRESRWMPSSPDSDDDDELDSRRLSNLFFDGRGHSREGRRSRWLRASRRNAPSWVEVEEEMGEEVSAAADGQSSADGVRPRARFFIQKDRSRISVKFDAPISGRYILLKLWSPVANGNIDVQSVAAYGFVGTRFFPSTGLT